jgi:hypothetical protein
MFSARDRTLLQVVANVYERGSWARVEHYHETCYQDAGAPYGPPPPPQTARFRAPGQLPPAHVLTTLGAGGQTVQGTCRCGWGWSGGSADDVSDAWATHVADSAPALF